MEREKILELLDKLDEFRRTHQDERQHPADYCMRVMEAIVARTGGFESRSDWTDALRADDTTTYSRDIKSGEFFRW